jgi:hypothetical protein
VHAALDPGFLFTNKITHIVNTAGGQVPRARARARAALATW